ncbi:MAG: hypothetical protein ABR903_07535 [Thermodesulfovibrionales bacterium]|jgi:hypothetical protein
MKGDLQRSIDIDVKINELKQRQLTPDNSNLLGDLYLKRGDKKSAVEYFYFAAKNSHKDKAGAIYKKILRLAPGEIKAYEALIDIFSQEGIVVEEVRYLLLLAQVYQSRGDVQKETELFRKILDLDPENNVAKLFFGRGKVDFEEVIASEESLGEKGEVPQEEEMEVEDRVTEETGIPVPARRRPVVVIVAVACFLCILLGISFYVSHRGKRRVEGPHMVKKSVPSGSEERPIESAKALQGKGYEIEVTSVTGDLLRQVALSSRLTEKEMSDNGFLMIKATAGKACVSRDLIQSPDQQVAIIDREGNRIAPRKIGALERLTKVIYQPYACGKELDIVYAHFYIAYPKEISLAGVMIDGMKLVFEKNTVARYTSKGKQ